jgi:hypothetical protein
MIPGLPTLAGATQALALTLFHSLWQIAALGLAAACVLFVGRTLSAQARYAVLCGTLAVMAVCPLVTFFMLLDGTPHATVRSSETVVVRGHE